MEIKRAYGMIEAVLFSSGDPLETAKIAEAVEMEESLVRQLLETMKDTYQREDSGLLLVELDRSFQLCTKPEFALNVKRAMESRRNSPLSNAAMEVLAIIAYNQPVTRAFVEQVRGVDSSQTVLNLVEKGLVEEAGRLEIPGRPISYRTTQNFLRNFGLKSLDELPPLPMDSEQAQLDEAADGTEREFSEHKEAFEESRDS